MLLVSTSRNMLAPAADLEPVVTDPDANAARLLIPTAKAYDALGQVETARTVVKYFDAVLAEKPSAAKVIVRNVPPRR